VSARATEETLADLFDDPFDVIADRRLRGSPGSRGAAAFDGDPTTAWQTPFDSVVGATLTVTHPEPIDGGSLTMSWLDDEQHSIPTEIVITGDDGMSRTIPIPATTPVDGVATVDLPLEDHRTTTSTITLSGVTERTTPEYFSGLPMILPVGITEISFGDDPPTNDPTAALDETCRTDLLTIDDAPIPVRITGTIRQAADRAELALASCGEPLELDAGRHVLRTTPGATSGFDVDRIVLDGSVTERPAAATPAVTVDESDDVRIDLTVAPSTSPAWLVLQQSWNAGWTASSDGTDLGAPILINGYANGWLLPPSETPRSITLEWAPQHTMQLALWFSLLAGIGVIGLLIFTRRDRLPTSIHDLPKSDDVENGHGPDTSTTERGWSRTSPIVAAALVLLVAFLAGPAVAVGALVVILLRKRWPWLALVVVLVAGAVVAGAITASEWRYDYPPGPDWPSRFDWTGPLVWLAVASVAVTAIMPDGVRRRK
jgi:arabinofuranan 3-O-arabinosyltransferase